MVGFYIINPGKDVGTFSFEYYIMDVFFLIL